MDSGAAEGSITATYDYRDESGKLLYQAVRFEPKAFRQRRPGGNGSWVYNLGDTRRVLYRLQELLRGNPRAPVFICEGERDVNRLIDELGLVATTNPMGANKWRDEYSHFLNDRRVVILPDNDDIGRAHAQQVTTSLIGAGVPEVKILELPGLPEKGDVSDWLDGGGTRQQLLDLAGRTRPVAGGESTGADGQLAAEGQSDSAQPMAEPAKSPSQATMLVDLASEVELFHDAQHNAYATIPIQDHRETHSLRSKAFRRWLAGRFWTEHRKAPHGQAVSNARATLESKALFDGPEEPVAVRLADHDGAIWLDLADERWRAIKVTRDGWEVVDNPPVKFLRPRGLLALPEPANGGTVTGLRRFLNLGSDDDWALLASWILASLRPTGPYPVLAVNGEQGSAKSTLCRLVRSVVDPNIAPLRTMPREVRDLMIGASNSWILAYDNLSHIPPWLSDALCRLATGGGFSTRELYTDDDEIIFDAMRPVMINGIEELATRSDLLDRAICLYLPTIPDGARRTEQELFEDFDSWRSMILGAFLDAVSTALQKLPTTRVENPPRMADFSFWATAGEQGLGLEHGAFLSAYRSNRADANALALEASVLAPVIQEFIGERNLWEGTAQDLLDGIDGVDRFEKSRSRRDWPKSPQALGKRLRRVAPNLRRTGISIDFDRGTGKERKRIIRLTRLDNQPSDMSEPSEMSDAGPDDCQTEGLTDMSDMSDKRIREDVSLAP